MCFAKSTPKIDSTPQESVVRHEADASLTKNSSNSEKQGGFKENIKTSALGLEDNANTEKKTLLGE